MGCFHLLAQEASRSMFAVCMYLASQTEKRIWSRRSAQIMGTVVEKNTPCLVLALEIKMIMEADNFPISEEVILKAFVTPLVRGNQQDTLALHCAV